MATPRGPSAVMLIVPISVSPGEKPEKFSGLNFKRWQQKMLFYLTTLNLARFLTEDAPKLKEDEHDIQVISAIDAWKHSDFLCRNYVMNGLADSLYNVYSDKKTAKELWESLDRKYKTEDAGLRNLLWNYLKHKRKEMSIEDLIIRLRIEEDNRRSEKKGAHTLNEAKANFVEHGQSSKAKTNNNKGKGSKLGPKGGISKKPKFQGKCFNCGKQGHKSVDCRLPKKNKPKEANVIDDITRNVSDIDLTAVVSEVNLVGSNPKEWWIDTGATRHVCSDKKMFSTFEPIENGEKVFMGNSATSEIKGQGKVILKMTSGKELTLTNVLYVRKFARTWCRFILNNHGFRLVFDSNKVVLSKSGMYVGKGYMSDGMWKLNVMTIIKSNMNKASTSTYMLESSNLWHGEPQTFKEAMNSEGLMWKEAIKSEIDSILQNHTWELVDLPPGCKPLSSKWIFKRKMKVDGSIDKYKARLVIKGYKQTESLDYFDTYSPVTRINSIRMQPRVSRLRDKKRKFVNLVKSLYGLKQASKQWHEKFDNVMLSHGFKINECDKCVYVKDTEHGYVIVCLYVDDMLIVGSDDKMITSTKNMLNSSQSHYVDKILGKFDKDNSGNKGESVSQVEYSRIIGSLMYLMSCTRPDIAYAVSKLSRYTSNPGAKHWQGIIRVLKYLRFTRYSDANWISNVKDSKSHSGYVFTLGGADVVEILKTTAEWLRHFLEDIPRWSKLCLQFAYIVISRHIRQRHNTIRQLLSTGLSVDYVKSKDNIADPLTKGLNRELVEKSSREWD
ncbi:hypothetical protein AAG906_000624 [Vitis piasezkii]